MKQTRKIVVGTLAVLVMLLLAGFIFQTVWKNDADLRGAANAPTGLSANDRGVAEENISLSGLPTRQESAQLASEPDLALEGAGNDPLEPLLSAFMQHAEASDPFMAILSGKPVTELPDFTLQAAQEDAQFAADMLQQFASIELNALDHQQQLTAAMLERQLRLTIEAPDHYWQHFTVTPYQAGFIFSSLLPSSLKSTALSSGKDVDVYLGLVADIGRFVNDQTAKLEGQAERGIRLPMEALPGVRGVFAGLLGALPQMVQVEELRTLELSVEDRERLNTGIENAMNEQNLPAIERLVGYLGDDYASRAPKAVGLAQYPGGKDFYRFLVRRETTLDLEPEEIHQRGLAYMADLQQQMKVIRDELGFTGSQQEFHSLLRENSRFYAKTPEEVEQRMREYIGRIKPKLEVYFSLMPDAPYDVKRLDPAAEAGMTFGYYQAPNAISDTGYYRYNGSDLDSRPQIWVGPLIYHELVPGHHFHLALQRENSALPEFRKTGTFITAFNEGWGNYGASLALEMGLLPDPYERYGWLLFDSFSTARLILDTGMNWYGWSLEKARQYMLDNTFSSEAEVATETLRYSTDLPAQALAYKLGLEKIREIRRDAEEKYGDDFDIRVFHAAVVGSGALPMPVLEQHVSWYLARHLNTAEKSR